MIYSKGINAFILCAGLGTRLRPFTEQKAKPSIPFLQVPLAHYVWRIIEPLGVQNLVVNLHHRPNDIRYLFKDLKPKCEHLFFSDETDRILDSGGALKPVRELFLKKGSLQTNSFIFANGDEIYIPSHSQILSQLYEEHVARDNLATLLVIDHPEVGKKFGGAWTQKNSLQVTCFSKNTLPEFQGWHYVGFMALSPRIFNFLQPNAEPENVLYQTLTKGILSGERVAVFPDTGLWHEVGNEADFLHSTEEVCNLLNKNSSPNLNLKNQNSNPGVEDLKQFLRFSFLEEPLIEKANPNVLALVTKTLSDLKNESIA